MEAPSCLGAKEDEAGTELQMMVGATGLKSLRGEGTEHLRPDQPFQEDAAALFWLANLITSRAEGGIVIGGHEVRPHSRPYMVFILVPMKRKPKSSVRVILGAHDILIQERTWQVIPVKETICHPDYIPKDYFNDIMILKLERKARQTAAVRTLSLPRGTAQVRPGEVCNVASWGKVAPNGRVSNTLRVVELTVQQEQVWEACLYDHYNSTTLLCGGDPNKRKSSFKGHSGGPLVYNNVIQGISRGGLNDVIPPWVFTKVSSFLPWMKETMKSYEKPLTVGTSPPSLELMQNDPHSQALTLCLEGQ
ncbi:granzyme B(G,H)-like [Equus caballus]|uniref:granzyme B(G,H)-like n=1 Tax=Equus caballus TaxID=9796 RepID=UPI0003ACBD1C|nr:granzyme B(G,H)-like [Equus caballus]